MIVGWVYWVLIGVVADMISGCCWLETMGCFLHDAACVNCKPRWFCLKWCEPGKKVKP